MTNSWIFPFYFIPEAWLRSYFKNSCIGFHRGFQTIENNKSTRLATSYFHQFSRVWKPWWNPRTYFWNNTWKVFFLIWFLCLFSTLPSHVGQVCHLGSNMTWNINKGNSHVLHEVASFLFWLVLRKEGKVFYCCSSMRTFLTYTSIYRESSDDYHELAGWLS